MNARLYIFCMGIFIFGCRDESSRDYRQNNIVAPHFEEVSSESFMSIEGPESKSIELNGINFHDCVLSEDQSRFVIKFSEEVPAAEFSIPRSGLSIRSIGFNSISSFLDLVRNIENDTDAINNSALVFGSGSKIRYISRGSFLILFSDGGVADDFLMVVSCDSENMVWFNPKVPFNGNGHDICHWLASRLSSKTGAGWSQ